MTSKERMMCALNLGKPDRLPVTVHQWQPFHLKYFMDGMTDVEAFRATGLDGALTFFPAAEPVSNNWKVTYKEINELDYTRYDYTIETPEGNLTYSMGLNEMTTWVMEHLIKNDEDIYLLKKYRPIPVMDKKMLEQHYDFVGDTGIVRTFVFGQQGGCWQDACCLYGTEEMIYACYDKPEWVHEFLGILWNQKEQFIYEGLKGAKADLIETGGGASSNTVISPDLHKEFCLPYDYKMHATLKNIGFPSVYHTCGGMTKLTDLILRNCCSASETLSPSNVGGDIKTPEDEKIIVDSFKGKIAMVGGMDQFGFLTEGTPEMIEKEVKRLFIAFGKDGGYILSASDHFFHAPKENLIAFANAAKECIYG
jgi:hypothetical protein